MTGPITFMQKTAIGRLRLYAETGVVGPVSASKQLFTGREFR